MDEILTIIEKERSEIRHEVLGKKRLSLEQKNFRRGRLLLVLDLISAYEGNLPQNNVSEELKRVFRYQGELEFYLEKFYS